MLQNKYIQLAPPSLSFAEQAADYYCRNREFLREYEPRREAAFFTAGRQREILEQEIRSQQAKLSFRFYIKPMAEPEKIIGIAALNNVVYGAFCSAFLGYKLDSEYLNRGYMTMAFWVPWSSHLLTSFRSFSFFPTLPVYGSIKNYGLCKFKKSPKPTIANVQI